MVGMLHAYAEAVRGDPLANPPVLGLTAEQQQETLGELSNKSIDGVVDAEVAEEVSDLLGIGEQAAAES